MNFFFPSFLIIRIRKLKARLENSYDASSESFNWGEIREISLSEFLKLLLKKVLSYKTYV